MGDVGFRRGLPECARDLVAEIEERQDTGEILIETFNMVNDTNRHRYSST